MGTVRTAAFSRSCLSPTIGAPPSNQLMQTPTTITVVANANGQLLVHPTTIVNHNHITIERNCNSGGTTILQNSNDNHSPTDIKTSLDEDDISASSDTDEHNMAERGPKTIVENTHYIAVPETATSRSYTSLTPVTPAIVQEGEAVTAEGVPHSAYVQYVDGNGDQTIYTTNGQMAYPVYTVGDTATTMYTPSNAQYFQPTNGTPVAYSQVIRVAANNMNQGNTQTQILNSGPYIIQQNIDADHGIIATTRNSPSNVTADVSSFLVNTNNAVNNITTAVITAPLAVNASNGETSSNITSCNNNGNNSDSNNVSHVTRIPPVTVQWLLDNYETAEGVSLPRSTLYFYYIHHCNECKLDPVNAASFGKLIRSVFLGLRTRRLGTRGNSKYHYYGIRLKPNSALHNLNVCEENGTPTRTNGISSQSQKKYKLNKSESGDSHYSSEHNSNSYNNEPSPQSQNRQFLGDSTLTIPDFPEINVNRASLPNDCSLDDVDTFRSIYREHCEMFLHAVENLEFTTIESLWREFWRCQDNLEDSEEERYLSKTKLYLLSKCAAVQQFVRCVDYRFYQNLVTFLVPDVLRPIPSTLTQSIRNFAKSLENWLTSAMAGCPRDIVNIKVTAVGAFAQTLRRYTSLNHLAQAARAVLQNSAQINQMLTDLNRVDFHNVQEQASWVCQCDPTLVERLEEDFKLTLQQQNSLEEWANWLKGVVDEVLKPYVGKKSYIKAARQFLLKWSFYSSMVIRDLTLRSAASFGSFHLIRLLYDEYMFYIIEHQIAKATGETPIAVMGEKYLTASPDLIECSLTNDEESMDANTEEINDDPLGDTSALLMDAGRDEHIVTPRKRTKLS